MSEVPLYSSWAGRRPGGLIYAWQAQFSFGRARPCSERPPIVELLKLLPRIPQMSNLTNVEVFPNVRKSAKSG